MNNIYAKTLPAKTAALVAVLQRERPNFLDNFYLSGGTALSLQLGHRESEDLDFFSQNNFEPTRLQIELEKFGHLENLEIAEGTLNAFLMGVKLQFLAYPYPLLEKFVDFQNIQLSSVVDIACTKLHTISMRGSKKDFVDLFFILQRFNLEELFEKLSQKYTQANFNQTHILKSLLYFSDAEKQPMPRIHHEVSWETIQKEIIKKVKLCVL
jgi:predicted nucleotidyltransferase component of viral defense system